MCAPVPVSQPPKDITHRLAALLLGDEAMLCRRKEEKDGAIVHMCDPDLIFIKVINGTLSFKEARSKVDALTPVGWHPVQIEWLTERFCKWQKA
jgi:hypothetical protein